MTHLQISELFYSIQGESTFAGYPCAFIRLADCNLRCSFCDARYTYDEKPVSTTIEDILSFTEEYPTALVEITGGEPLLQEGVYPLMEELLRAKRVVLLETNGSVSLAEVPDGVIKIMDLKCPDSGMSDKMDMDNLGHLSPADELKCVICSRNDYLWAVETIRRYLPGFQNGGSLKDSVTILFSPVTAKLAPELLAQWILEDQIPVRLQLQLHTILWPTKKRGV